MEDATYILSELNQQRDLNRLNYGNTIATSNKHFKKFKKLKTFPLKLDFYYNIVEKNRFISYSYSIFAELMIPFQITVYINLTALQIKMI